jgi:glucose/arabinose dehydrogenase
MRRLLLLLAVLTTFAVSCTTGSSDRANSPRTVPIGAGLQGPSGLTAVTFATGVANVAALTVDGQGRVWAASAAFEDAGTDAIYVIDREGATPHKVIADSHTPLGLLWMGAKLLVSQKEAVMAYSGFSGTAFATSRVVLQLPVGVGEVNGMALGPDGRIHLGISSPCDSCTPTNELSGSVVSFLPAGGDLRVDATGIRAPIGLAFRAATGALYVTMNQRDDLGAATPGDWVAVVEVGQSWGFPGCYGQGGPACATAPSPIAELDEHAAVSGIALITDQLGTAFQDVALVAEWTKGVVFAIHLDPDDGTGTEVEPFLSGLQNPVPVVAAPSGGVLVGDWSTGVIYLVTA